MKNMIRKTVAFIAISLLAAGQAYAAATVTYYHHDALGSVIASSHENGWVNWNEEYQPYGEKIYDTVDNEGGSDEFYTGKNYNSDIDLTYFGARWYDAKQGRFLSMDPVGVKLENIHSFNRYAYASNNPYKYVDPDGEEVTFFGNPTFQQAQAQALQNKFGDRIDAARGIQSAIEIQRHTVNTLGAAEDVFGMGALAAGFAAQPEIAVPAGIIAGSASILKVIVERPRLSETGAKIADQLIAEGIPNQAGKAFVEIVGPTQRLEEVINSQRNKEHREIKDDAHP